MGDLGVYETSGLSDGTYNIRARAYNYFGVKGNWVQPDPFSLAGQAAPPENVTNFSYNLSGNNINLQWTPVGDADLSYYKVRYTSDESGSPDWSKATDSVEKIARPASSVNVPARAGTYMIRAYDKLQKGSPNFAFVVVPTGSLDTFINNNILSE
jgi:predicted phage tail protein